MDFDPLSTKATTKDTTNNKEDNAHTDTHIPIEHETVARSSFLFGLGHHLHEETKIIKSHRVMKDDKK